MTHRAEAILGGTLIAVDRQLKNGDSQYRLIFSVSEALEDSDDKPIRYEVVNYSLTFYHCPETKDLVLRLGKGPFSIGSDWGLYPWQNSLRGRLIDICIGRTIILLLSEPAASIQAIAGEGGLVFRFLKESHSK